MVNNNMDSLGCISSRKRTLESISVEEAQARLTELIDKLAPGQEVLLTRDDKPVSQLISLSLAKPYPKPGRCHGVLTVLLDDDEHLQDWNQYMP